MKEKILIGLILVNAQVWSQIPLTIEQADSALLKNNLALLAEQYNISAAQAEVIQAKIWNLPYLSTEFNAINPQENKNFDIGSDGQKGIAIEQLIYLGGKKRNEVLFAKGNILLAQLQFEQLLRTLKYQLAANFYALFYDLQKIKSLDLQISKLDTLVQSYQSQSLKGNLPLKEVVRLQTLLLNLTNERNLYRQDVLGYRKELSVLTGIEDDFAPITDDFSIERYNYPKLTKGELLDRVVYNPEYKSAMTISNNQELFVKWQKSLAVPDLTAGLSYDQRGGAFKDQVNINIGIPLPLWNRNKGNIAIAQARSKQSKISADFKKQLIIADIQTAWDSWQQQHSQLIYFNQSVRGNLEQVFNGMLNNFQRRNISMIEFTDFMESYNQATIQINETKKRWILASLQLNYASNSEVF